MNQMRRRQFFRTIGTGTAVAVGVLGSLLISSWGGQASENEGNDDESKIQQGFAIAPVPLNLAGKDRALVGLGSYIVNAQADCNGCHFAGPPIPEFAPGADPYQGQNPAKVNPDGYLGGGLPLPVFLPNGQPVGVVFSRNLTPDKTERPEGGHTFPEFLQIIRTGVDMDHLHPTCSATITTNCLPPPLDGSLLQVMPWPIYKNMTDRDLRAIYEYLSAIPCVAGPPAPNPRHNDCP